MRLNKTTVNGTAREYDRVYDENNPNAFL